MDDVRLRALRWAVIAMIVADVVALIVKGADRPSDPVVQSFAEFGRVAFSVRAPGSRGPTDRCALLAESEAQRQRGLMEQRDLGGYDAMVFRFPTDTRTTFYMRNTPLPLSIAWFTADGRYVDQDDMAPCVDRDGCPLHRADGPYRYAVEVPQGGLDDLGIGPGSQLVLGSACG